MNRRTFLGGVATAGLFGTTRRARATARDAARGRAPAYEPLGEVAVDGAKEAVVSGDGSTVFLAVGDGFAVVDVSDPTAPAVIAEEHEIMADHEQGPLRRIWDVKYADGELVVASQGGANGPLYAFVVYDVSDPATPRRRLVREVEGQIHNCDVNEGHVYVTGLHRGHHEGTDTAARLPVEIYDVRGATAEMVADWSPLDRNPTWAEVPTGNRVIHDVSVVADRAYLAYWDAGAYVLDVSDPAEPAFLSRVGEFTAEELAERSTEELRAERTEGPAGNAHYVTASSDGSLMGVGKESWDVPETEGGGAGGIDLYDLSDPTAPERWATIEPERSPDETYGGVWTTAHNFEIRGDRLYSSWYRGGVKIHDVSDPGSPELLAWWLQPRSASFWTAQLAVPGEFFVAPSTDDPGAPSDSREALLTFPDRAGEQADRPSLDAVLDATPTPASTTGESPTSSGTGSTEPTPTADAGRTTPTEGATPTGGRTGSTASTTTDGQPGFGAALALGGLGIGAYRHLRGAAGSTGDAE